MNHSGVMTESDSEASGGGGTEVALFPLLPVIK